MNEKKETETNNVFGALLGITILPVMIAWFLPQTMSGNPLAWKVRYVKRGKIIFAFALSVLLSFIYLTKVLPTYFIFSLKSLVFHLLVFWILLIPSSFSIFYWRLAHVATDLEQGRLTPSKSASTRTAIAIAGIERAKQLFEGSNFQIPNFSKSNKPVIGFISQAPDLRTLSQRKMEPEHFQLQDMKDGELLTFPLNGTSPSHHLVIGATGSGKTTLLSRMASAALENGFRVAIIDFKGGNEEAQLFKGIANHVKSDVRTVCWPGNPMDLWRGSTTDISDRVIGFLPAPSPGGSEYYRARIMRAIKAVVERTSESVPRSADELIYRIRNAGSYVDDPEDRDVLLKKAAGGTVASEIAEALGSYLEPLRMTGEYATTGGWSWSDHWDLAVISLDSTKEQMKRLGGSILHDFDAWTRSSARNLDPRPMMIIVDEGGVLQSINGAPALSNLVARARSARVSVVIAAQTLSSLGPDGEQILPTGTTRWLGRSPDPEMMAMAAGTRSVSETGHQDGIDGFTGVRTIREQRALLIDPDFIRSLPTFVWVISEHGKVISGYCPPISYRA